LLKLIDSLGQIIEQREIKNPIVNQMEYFDVSYLSGGIYHLIVSDEKNKVRKQFGVPTNMFGLLPGRVTYVADKTGKVISVFNSQTQVEKHVEEAMKVLKKTTDH